jgi:UDP-glucuronate 4-epimerase
MKKILVTGAAGFIGYHLTRRLCADGKQVLGIDNVSAYYDVALKYGRLDGLKDEKNFRFEKADLQDMAALSRLFDEFKPDAVVNLAAQAGVRYSLEDPKSYIDSNLSGFGNVLEACRHHDVKHLVFASSSSVYGANTKLPFSVADNVDHPISLYAATKKANELMAHSYAHLFGLPCTGLRFFTVYGPWGRPDMSVFKFTKAIYEGQPIDVYNNGNMQRDFTYVDDIVEGVARLIQVPAAPDPAWSGDAPNPATSYAPYRLFNIGNNNPVELMEMIRLLEKEIGISAQLNMMDMQPGDVQATFADVQALEDAVGFKPNTPLEKGLRNFVRWYRDYHGMGNGPAVNTVAEG